MWLQFALPQLSCSLFSQVTLRTLFIISKPARSKPLLIFGQIIVVCLILGFAFHTNSEIAVLTNAAKRSGCRCIVNQLRRSKAVENCQSTIQGEVSCRPKVQKVLHGGNVFIVSEIDSQCINRFRRPNFIKGC